MSTLRDKNDLDNKDLPPPEKVWIYHERQEALLCGQHALNNLLQGDVFSPHQLAQVAQELDQLELEYMAQNNEGGVRSADYQARLREGSHNVDERGNFSIQVLQQCMDRQLGLEHCLPHYTPAVLPTLNKQDVTELHGFLCHKSDHWFAIRWLAGRFFNLNSTLERPTVVSHFQLGSEMDQFQSQGYTVFCLRSNASLPNAHVGDYPPQSSAGQGQWHCMSDLLRGTSSSGTGGNGNARSAGDPWRSLTGQGLRLDGKATATSSSTTMQPSQAMQIDGLTEEEQLQLALQLSEAAAEQHVFDDMNGQKNDQDIDDDNNNKDDTPVPVEPDAFHPQACRIQFRCADQRKVRRFVATDTVQGLYAYCRQEFGSLSSTSTPSKLELRAGFPPQSLDAQRHATLQDAQLTHGESIQVRWTN